MRQALSEEFQADLRMKIEELSESLSLSNHPWNEWEIGFIEDMSKKLTQKQIHVSPKQYDTIWNLWDKL